MDADWCVCGRKTAGPLYCSVNCVKADATTATTATTVTKEETTNPSTIATATTTTTTTAASTTTTTNTAAGAGAFTTTNSSSSTTTNASMTSTMPIATSAAMTISTNPTNEGTSCANQESVTTLHTSTTLANYHVHANITSATPATDSSIENTDVKDPLHTLDTLSQFIHPALTIPVTSNSATVIGSESECLYQQHLLQHHQQQQMQLQKDQHYQQQQQQQPNHVPLFEALAGTSPFPLGATRPPASPLFRSTVPGSPSSTRFPTLSSSAHRSLHPSQQHYQHQPHQNHNHSHHHHHHQHHPHHSTHPQALDHAHHYPSYHSQHLHHDHHHRRRQSTQSILTSFPSHSFGHDAMMGNAGYDVHLTNHNHTHFGGPGHPYCHLHLLHGDGYSNNNMNTNVIASPRYMECWKTVMDSEDESEKPFSLDTEPTVFDRHRSRRSQLSYTGDCPPPSHPWSPVLPDRGQAVGNEREDKPFMWPPPHSVPPVATQRLSSSSQSSHDELMIPPENPPLTAEQQKNRLVVDLQDVVPATPNSIFLENAHFSEQDIPIERVELTTLQEVSASVAMEAGGGASMATPIIDVPKAADTSMVAAYRTFGKHLTHFHRFFRGGGASHRPTAVVPPAAPAAETTMVQPLLPPAPLRPLQQTQTLLVHCPSNVSRQSAAVVNKKASIITTTTNNNTVKEANTTGRIGRKDVTFVTTTITTTTSKMAPGATKATKATKTTKTTKTATKRTPPPPPPSSSSSSSSSSTTTSASGSSVSAKLCAAAKTMYRVGWHAHYLAKVS